jgi:hypothetical protein
MEEKLAKLDLFKLRVDIERKTSHHLETAKSRRTPKGGLKARARFTHKPVALAWRQRQSSFPPGLGLPLPRPPGVCE